MSFAPYVVLWVALAVASALLIPASRRPRFGLVLSFGVPLAALLAGLFLRPGAEVPAWDFAGRQWAITETAYYLTGAVLLLLLASVAWPYFLSTRADGRERFEPALLFALAAASLPALWAADDRSRALGLTLFLVAWVGSDYLLGSREVGTPREWFLPAARLVGALFCAWASAALPAWRVPLSLLASAVLMGVWPFVARPGGAGAAINLLGEGLAVAIGAAVAAAALQLSVPSGPVVAAATALGLLSVLVGLSRAWQTAPERTASALRPALGGLALMAAAWLDPDVLAPAARLAMFAPAALMAAAGLDERERSGHAEESTGARRRVSPGLIAMIMVLLSVVGLPLTVGFGVFPPLYTAWWDAGGWLLLLLTILLLSLWAAALVRSGREMTRGGTAGRVTWLRAMAMIPALLGLVSPRIPMAGLAPLIWIALAVPLIIGVVLLRFAPGLDNLGGLLHEAASLPQPAGQLAGRVRRAGKTVRDALVDALAILEGEYGLLWLLGILLLLLWIA